VNEDGSFVSSNTIQQAPRADGSFDLKPIEVKPFSTDRAPGAPMLERQVPGMPEINLGRPDVSDAIEGTGYREGYSADNYPFSGKELRHIVRVQHRDVDHELSRYFGDNYDRSRDWKAIGGMDADTFASLDRGDIRPQYVGLYDDIKQLGATYPVSPEGKSVAQYMNVLYEYQERDIAFQKEVAEMTRERVVMELQKFFGNKPWRSDAWHELGKMDAIEFMKDPEALPERYQEFYQDISDLIHRGGSGPNVLPEGERDLKHYLEFLYEENTKKELGATIYSEMAE
jgi:hypothetical protein